jgi:ankyrin repeat protein
MPSFQKLFTNMCRGEIMQRNTKDDLIFESNNIEAIKLFFSAHSFIDSFPNNESRLRLLQAACVTEDEAIIDLVTSYYPQPLIEKYDSELSILHAACLSGYTETVKWLLSKYKLEDFKQPANKQLSPLRSAIYHPSLLALFIQYYPDKSLFADSPECLLSRAIKKYLRYVKCKCGYECDCPSYAEVCKQSIQLLLAHGAGICADVSGLEKIEMDFKNYLFIGATCNNQPAQFKDAIHDAAEFKKALLRGTIFKKIINDVVQHSIIQFENQASIELKKVLPYFLTSLKQTCLWNICLQYQNKELSSEEKTKLPTDLFEETSSMLKKFNPNGH